MKKTKSALCVAPFLFCLFSVATASVVVAAAGLVPLGDFNVSKYHFGIPSWAPIPLEPIGNPTTKAKTELGRHLFYDKRLSVDESMSCASCHKQELAFTDGLSVSVGVTGEKTVRNSISLVNSAYFPTMTWAHPFLLSPEQQALIPLLGTTPPELGLHNRDQEALKRLKSDPQYVTMFKEAFPEANGEISLATVTRALGAFVRSIVSFRSSYDRYRYENDFSAMSDQALRGEALFFGEKAECHHCHSGINFTDSERHSRLLEGNTGFHNTGLYNIDGQGAYPPYNTGIYEITGRSEDMGRMRTPSLRNVALTAPYFHDGSAQTLEEVIEHYASGGRTISMGPHKGAGRTNPHKSHFITGFILTTAETEDLIAFLKTLTDEAVLTDPRYSNPWPQKIKEPLP